MSDNLPSGGETDKASPKRSLMSKLLSMGRGAKEPEPEDEVQVSYEDVTVWGQALTKDEVEELNSEFTELLTELELDASKYFNRSLEDYEAPVDVYEDLSQKLEADNQEVDVSETLATRLGDDHPLVVELRRREALADVRLLDEHIKEALGPEKAAIIYKKVPDEFHTPLDYYKELQAGAKSNGLDLIPVIEDKLGKTHPLPMALRGDREAAKGNWVSLRKAMSSQMRGERGWNPALTASQGSAGARDMLLAVVKQAKEAKGDVASVGQGGLNEVKDVAGGVAGTKDQQAGPKDVSPAPKAPAPAAAEGALAASVALKDDPSAKDNAPGATVVELYPEKESKDMSKETSDVPKGRSDVMTERNVELPLSTQGTNGRGSEDIEEKPKGSDDQENKPAVANATGAVSDKAVKDRGFNAPVRDETHGDNARFSKWCSCFGMR